MSRKDINVDGHRHSKYGFKCKCQYDQPWQMMSDLFVYLFRVFENHSKSLSEINHSTLVQITPFDYPIL